MPYKSDKQRRFMHAKHPGIAQRWDEEIRNAQKPNVKKSMPDGADLHVMGNLKPVRRRKGRLKKKDD